MASRIVTIGFEVKERLRLAKVSGRLRPRFFNYWSVLGIRWSAGKGPWQGISFTNEPASQVLTHQLSMDMASRLHSFASQDQSSIDPRVTPVAFALYLAGYQSHPTSTVAGLRYEGDQVQPSSPLSPLQLYFVTSSGNGATNAGVALTKESCLALQVWSNKNGQPVHQELIIVSPGELLKIDRADHLVRVTKVQPAP